MRDTVYLSGALSATGRGSFVRRRSWTDTYTGIVVTFAEGKTTELLGSVAFDYTRSLRVCRTGTAYIRDHRESSQKQFCREAILYRYLDGPGKKDYVDMDGFELVVK
jgi:hypothetical protein